MLTVTDTHYTWEVGDALQLSHYFNTSEFTCVCHKSDAFKEWASLNDKRLCVAQSIRKELIDNLEQLRSDFNHPIRVTSGIRCYAYQEYLKTTGLETSRSISRHVFPCDAADIYPISGYLHDLYTLAVNNFNGIGLGRNFLHVDCRDKKTHWFYAV